MLATYRQRSTRSLAIGYVLLMGGMCAIMIPNDVVKLHGIGAFVVGYCLLVYGSVLSATGKGYPGILGLVTLAFNAGGIADHRAAGSDPRRAFAVKESDYSSRSAATERISRVSVGSLTPHLHSNTAWLPTF